ncbi:aguA, partial [Symbiodinium sp. KB8]
LVDHRPRAPRMTITTMTAMLVALLLLLMMMMMMMMMVMVTVMAMMFTVTVMMTMMAMMIGQMLMALLMVLLVMVAVSDWSSDFGGGDDDDDDEEDKLVLLSMMLASVIVLVVVVEAAAVLVVVFVVVMMSAARGKGEGDHARADNVLGYFGDREEEEDDDADDEAATANAHSDDAAAAHEEEHDYWEDNGDREVVDDDVVTRPAHGLMVVPAVLFAVARTMASFRMPDESEQHAATWMVLKASKAIWGGDLAPYVEKDLVKIAKTIAKYEAATWALLTFFSVKALVAAKDRPRLRRLLEGVENIEVLEAEADDLWVRDSGPVFTVSEAGVLRAVKFNFNGWGQKQRHSLDNQLAEKIADLAGVELLTSSLVLEGGGIEVDGDGTAIITESCVLNANRNPGVTKEAAEAELKSLLGLQKIIWLPGVAGKDITDGHTDFYARFVKPGTVVAALDPDPRSFDKAVTEKHLALLQEATDAKGRKIEVLPLPVPSKVRRKSEDFAAGYVNFYVTNGAVLVPEFGDPVADGQALKLLQELFPGRVVEQLNIDNVAEGGGGIHCVTQQQPAGVS